MRCAAWWCHCLTGAATVPALPQLNYMFRLRLRCVTGQLLQSTPSCGPAANLAAASAASARLLAAANTTLLPHAQDPGTQPAAAADLPGWRC
jgi:hypothetical protein